jgi:hypothetical protein
MAAAWDVVEESTGAAPGDGEWDVAAEQPVAPKRQIGLGETVARTARNAYENVAAYAPAPVVGVARLFDLANEGLGLRRGQPSYTEMVGERFVEPALRGANAASVDNSTETAGPVGDVAINLGGELGKFAPDLVTGGGLQTAAPKRVISAVDPVLRAVATRLADSSWAGAPAALRRSQERQHELVAAGVDPLEAVPQAAASGVMTGAQFALPVSAGSALPNVVGRVLSRGGQGAALGTTAGMAAQSLENDMAPDSLQQDIFTPENMVSQAVLNAIFGQLGGRNVRAPRRSRADLGYDYYERAGLEPVTERPAPYDPKVEVDPMAALKEVNEALFRTEAEPMAPDFKLIPKGQEAPAGRAPEPDVSEVPVRVAPEYETDGIASRMRREFGEPRIEPTESPAVRIAERAEAATDRMEPDVPMRILKTISSAARDSGLESRITPRIVPLADQGAPPKITTERPPEPIPATRQLDLGGEAPPSAREPVAPPPAPPVAAAAPSAVVPSKPAARKGTTFLQAVKKAGGIDPKFAAEVGRDTAMQLNRRLPGLMRRGGLSEDGLLEWAQQNGYLTDADIKKAENEPGGALEKVKDLVRRAMADEDIVPLADQDAAFARDAEARYRDEKDYHEHRMKTDPEYRAEQEALDKQDADAALRENDLPPESAVDVDLVAKASKIDEGEVERLSVQHADDDAAFMAGIRRLVDGNESAKAGERGEVAEPEARSTPPDAGAEGGRPDEAVVRAADEPGQRGGAAPDEARPAFELERPSEAELRLRAERERSAAADRGRVERAPDSGDFTLTGSDRPADEAAARGQADLLDEPKKSSGGSNLYGGIPLDKVADALKWAFGDAKSWSDSVGRLAADIKATMERAAPSAEGNVVGRFFRAVFDSASGDMRAAVRRSKSATAQSVVDHFHTEAGTDRVTGEIYSSAVNSWTNQQLTKLDEAIKPFDANQQALAQIAALVRNPQNIKPGSRVHDAAKVIRTMLDDALKYMKEAGVEIGEVKGGYYPREFDMRAVMRDPGAFIKAAAQAYRENGASAKDADAAAQQLHDGMVFGESGSIFRADKGSPQAPFMKGRVFGKSVDSEKHPLNAFLINDPSISIPIYLERAAKRAEIARRFGDNFSKWGEIEKKIIDEGGGAALDKLRDYVALAARLKNPGVSDTALRAASVARTWGSLMFLEKATLSSLSEFIVPAIRSGNALDIGRSLRNTLDDLFTKSKGAEERRAFAEDLGIISARLSDQVSAARFSGGEPVSMLESKILAKYFRRTGLTQWTDATFVSAADMGRVFLRRLAKENGEGGGKLNDRYLAELGVPKEKAAEFSKFVLSKNDGMVAAGDLTGPMGDLYRNAVKRFAQQSIMRPDATLRPGWMAHPLGSIVGQLQSFNYAFFENVWKRNLRLGKEALTAADYTMIERGRMLAPLLTMPLLTAAAFAIGEARDAAFGDPEKRKEETPGQKVLKAASRGTPIAPIDPLVNYATSARYQRSAADNFAGPVLGTAGRGMDAARQVLLNNTPKTNTAERQAAKAAYDIFIEPTVNLMLTASPVTAAAAVATQAAGSGRTREKFVEAVAGPAKKSPPRPRLEGSTTR